MARAVIDEAMIQAVLAQLEAAAAAGQVCPANKVICARHGLASVATATNLIAKLERRGLIRVERGAATRVVTIVATGRSTGGTIIGRRVARGKGTGYREYPSRAKAAKAVDIAPPSRPAPPPAPRPAPIDIAPCPLAARGYLVLDRAAGEWSAPVRDHGGGCRWIDGTPGRPGWSWCGQARRGIGSWCADHHAIVFIRRPRKEGRGRS